MKPRERINQAKVWVTRGLKTRFPWRLVAGAALGALFLTIVVGVPLGSTDAGIPSEVATSSELSNLTSVGPLTEDEALPGDAWRFDPPFYDNVSANKENRHYYRQQRVADNIQDVAEFFGEEVVEALGFEVLAARLRNYQADGSLSSRDLERLDQEVDVLLLMTARQNPSNTNAAYDREIEHLQEEISTLLAETRQDPTTNPLQLDREVRRLDYQIEVLRLAEMD